MKSINYNFLLFCFVYCVLTINANAQEANKEKESLLIKYSQLVSNNFFVEGGGNLNTNKSTLDNVILINQIGTNVIDLKIKEGDSQTINQIGDKNYYTYINYYKTIPSNFNILQQGNSNSLQIYGENSIIKNMSIIQNTDFKSIIIKNY